MVTAGGAHGEWSAPAEVLEYSCEPGPGPGDLVLGNENNNVGPFRQQEVSQFKKLSE